MKLESTGAAGTTHTLGLLTGGGAVGEASLFSEAPSESSAFVREDAVVCHVPREVVLRLTDEYPALARRLLAELARELQSSEARYCGLTDKSALERVAEAVLYFGDQFPEQSWSRKDIAEWAGTSIETVVRALSAFARQGLLRLKGQAIRVLDRPRLLKAASTDRDPRGSVRLAAP